MDNYYTAPHLLLPPNHSFQCSEKKENHSVLFSCNLPKSSLRLEFACRSPSCGALHENEPSVHTQQSEEDEDECLVDPNFFDSGYTMAGLTGFTIWTGTRLLIETLCWRQDCYCDRLTTIQRRLANARVLELGAGVGVVGVYIAASVGSSVLLTDLPTLVENAIEDNLARNEAANDKLERQQNNPTKESHLWLGPNPHRIGNGWASSASLDWTRPIYQQLTPLQSQSIDFIVASDVVFLVSMLQSLLNTVSSLFASSSHNDPSFLLSFQRRDSKDGEESISFTTVNRVIREVKQRGWTIDCLAWRPVMVMKETKNGEVAKVESQVFVFEIRP
ncbi:hypothetical protein HJC23_004987 [Cyclotella cryptica]|uniref:Uncharacterized protein n=1 Tax=Cyclotella cryptica TaxID=29204 RepID=A0ABD3P8F8_9STRA|eukprot:CCRYP_017089-RA/>CCRYP_017089-RA protein AED:0.01 eAED:0.00 QI:0/-1/0/1/-1/1/1/0/331